MDKKNTIIGIVAVVIVLAIIGWASGWFGGQLRLLRQNSPPLQRLPRNNPRLRRRLRRRLPRPQLSNWLPSVETTALGPVAHGGLVSDIAGTTALFL
jgi:hypothetical protein